MKIYIAGAVTDNPGFKKQFADKEKELLKKGYAVINPVKNFGFSYREYIDMGLCQLMKCDAIYLMKGWENSKGAQFEERYAELCGLTILEET